MRATIDIDDGLIEEAMKLTKAKTKKEAVNQALRELVRRKRIENLREKLGKMDLDLDLETLKKLREEG